MKFGFTDVDGALPYEFDTARVWRTIAKLAIAFTVLMILLLLIAVIVGKFVAAIQLAVVLAIVAFFAARVRSFPMGAAGTITATEVVTRAVDAFGVSLRVPVGRFRVDQFQSIRVEERLATQQTAPDKLITMVYLVGRGSVPKIQVFSGNPADAATIARDLSAALNLELDVEGRLRAF